MNSLFIYNNKNKLLYMNKAISFKWSIPKRNYSIHNSINLYYFNNSKILSGISQNLNIYTHNENISYYTSFREYSNINSKNNKTLIDDDIKSLLMSNNSLNDILNDNIINTVKEKQNHDDSMKKNLIDNVEKQKADISTIEKNSYSFFKKLFSYRKIEKQETKGKERTEIDIDIEMSQSISAKNEQIDNKPICTLNDINKNSEISTLSSQSHHLKSNLIDNSNDLNNTNKNFINEKIDKKDISLNVEMSINSCIKNQNLNEFPFETIKNDNSLIESFNKENYEVKDGIEKEPTLIKWISSLFHGKNQSKNVFKEEKVIEQNEEKLPNINDNNIEDINMTLNIPSNSTNSNINTHINTSLEHDNTKKTILTSDIITKEKQNEKVDLNISIRNFKNWFNNKIFPKKQNELESIKTKNLIELDNDMDKFAIENELRDILNDSTVDSVENIINNATKGIILPTKNPLTEPQKNTLSYKFNRLCHRINQYFFPITKKFDESKLSNSLKIINHFTKTSLDARRIVILGVHGWFPKRSIQKLTGDPTGTSEKFCQEMAYSVITFFNDLGMEITNENISQIPLNGEGIIENRVDILYDQLEKRMDEVQNADIVLVSAHSQGTPVSVFLLNRLLENKKIDPERQTVGMVAMAGIHHGPSPIMRDSRIVNFVFSSKDKK